MMSKLTKLLFSLFLLMGLTSFSTANDIYINSILTHTVLDETYDDALDVPPTFSNCPPSDVIVSYTVDECGAVVTWTPPTASADAVSVTSNYSPGDSFLPGTTAVIYRAEDATGNVTVCTFNVIVEDDQDPVFETFPSDVTLTADPNTCTAAHTWAEPTASDNCPAGEGEAPVLQDFENAINQCYTFTRSSIEGGGVINGSRNLVSTGISSGTFFASSMTTPVFYFNGFGEITFSHSISSTNNSPSIHLDVLDENGTTITSSYFSKTYTTTGVQQEIIPFNLVGNYQIKIRYSSTSLFNSGMEAYLDDLLIPGTIVTNINDTSCEIADYVIFRTDGTGLDSGDQFDIGTTTIRYTVRDASGNFVERSFNITVENDVNPPSGTTEYMYCEGDTPPEMSVSVDVAGGETANWYDEYGTLVATGVTTYTAPATGEFYRNYLVYSQNANGCTSENFLSIDLYQIPKPPTPVADGPIEYCVGETATALTATALSNHTLNWYTVATGGTAAATEPTPSTAAAGTTSYYVSQTDDSTSCESDRTQIDVIVYAIPTAPVVNSPVDYCIGDKAGELNSHATGTNLRWYDAATGGNEIAGTTIPDTSTVGQQSFWVTQSTVNGTANCEGGRTRLLVNVYDAPVVTTQPTNEAVCEGGSVTFDVAASGSGVIQWQLFDGTNWNDLTNTAPHSGVTTNTLTVANVTLAMSGNRYRAIASSPAASCSDATSDEAILTVNTAPPVPTSGGDITECEQDPIQTLTATATPPSGASIIWYDALTGGNVVASPTLHAVGTVTYYAESNDTVNGCPSVGRTAVILTIQPAPVAPTSGGDITECEQDPIQTLTATATVPSGSTLVWYDAASGGNVVANPEWSSVGTEIYYAESQDDVTSCPSVTRTAVSLTIQPAPAAPTSGGDITECEQNPIQTLTATASVPSGFTMTWYDAANGGNVVASPEWSAVGSVTYYAESQNNTSACISLSRTPVTLTIDAIPDAPISGGDQIECEGNPTQTMTATATAPAGLTVDWYTAATGGSIVGSPTLNAVGTVTYYAESRTTSSGCISETRTAVVLTMNSTPTIAITPSSQTCSADLTTYSVSVDVNRGTVTSTEGTVTDNGGNNWTISGVTSGNNITVTVTDANTCSETISINAPNCACPTVNAPTSGGDQTECEQDPIQTLTAMATPPAGASVVWYDAASGGNMVASPTWNTVGSITYYAESVDDVNACTSTTRTAVNLTIQVAPTAPISGGDQTECEASPTQTLTATATCAAGTSIVWYDAATGGNVVANPEWSTIGTEIFYAESQDDATSCVSHSRTAVSLTINPIPTAPISGGDITQCKTSPIQTLTAMATAPAGSNVVWYDAATGGSVVASPTWNTVGSVTYYAESENSTTSCVSENRTPVHLTIQDTPDITIATAATCAADLLTYSVSVDVSEGTVTSTEGTVTDNGGNNWTISNITSGTDITLTVTAPNTCVQTLDITAPDCACPVVDAPVSGGNQTECEENSIQTLTATATPPTGATVVWYDAATGGNVVASPTLNAVNSVTYYAESRDNVTNCVSGTRAEVVLTINATPTAPISGGDITECESSPIQTLIATATASAGSNLVWYDAAAGGNVIASPILDTVGSVTYYAESEDNTSSCTSFTRTPVHLTIQDTPDITIATAATCSVDLLTYSVSVDVSEGTVTSTEGTVTDNGGNNWTISNITSGNDITLTVTAPNTCAQTLDITAPDCACPVVDAPVSGGDQTECEENPIQTLTAMATPPTGATVVWYDAATGGNIVASPTLNAVNTVTYYAESRDNVTNCVSGTRTAVMLTINATPTAPVSGGDITECETSPIQSLTATATAPAGSSVVWFDAATGGSVVASPILNTVGSVTYYAESEDNTSACPSFTRTPVSLTIQDTPDITIATAATCAADLLTYSVSVDVSEGTVTSTEGTVTDNGGNNWTISNITSGNDITLTVTAPNTCTQTMAVTAPDCACPVVDAPISGGDITECEENPIQTLTATATPPAGATVVWYDAVTGGNVVADPSLNTTGTATYYAESRDNVTNCVSGTRTAVMLTINATPTAPISGGDITECETSPVQTLTATATSSVGSSVVWYDAATGGNVVASPILNTVGSVTYYAESEDNTSSCTSFTRTAVSLTIQDTPDITIATAATCAADLLTYSVSVDVSEGTVTSTEGTVTDNGGNNWTISNITSGTDITLTVTAPNTCTQTLDITAPDCACPVVDAPTSGGNQTECEENPIQTLTATATPPAGATVVWYDASTGGSIVADPSLNTTGTATYYAESRDNVTNCLSSTRTAVVLTIEAAPTAPTSGGDQVACEQNPIQTLTATATAIAGSNVVWYDAATGGNIVASPTLNTVGTTIYFAQSENTTTSCTSLSRTAVSLTIEAAPTAPVSGGDITECETSPIQTLTATASAPAGSSVVWYDAATGGNVVASPILNTVGSATYYAESENNTSSCTSLARTQVNLTIQDTPDITIATAATCAPDLLTYSVSVDVSEGTVTSSEGTVVDNGGNNWTISDITSGNNITLTVTAPNTCTQTMSVTAPDCACPVVDAPISGGNQTECEENPIQTLTATATPPADATIVWYDAATGGNIVADPSLNTVGMVSYFAESVQNVTNCLSSTRTEVVLTIQATPPAPISGGDQTECEQSPMQTLTATATAPSGYSIVWYDAATGGSVVASPILNAVGSVTYYAEKVDDASSCTSFTRTPVSLTINALPNVIANASITTINAGEPVTLSGSGATSYVWDNSVTDGDTVYPLVTTTYTVIGTDGNTCENTDSVTITVNATSDIEIVHSVDVTNPNVGDTVTFTLTATNNGPSDDTGGTVINDLLPAGYTYVGDTGSAANGIYDSATGNWTLPSLSNGASVSVEIAVTVNAPTGATNEYLNIAQVTSATNYDSDSVPNNDDGDQSEDDEASASIVPQVADLEVTNTISQPSANPGDALIIIVDVLNNGPDDVTNVSIENVVPVGFTVTGINDGGTQSGNNITWSGLTIANGTTATMTFNVDVNNPVNTTDEYLNTVQVIAVDQFDNDSTPNNDDGDQSEDDEDNVELRLQSTDLEIINTVTPGTGNPGDVLTFTVEVVNNGTDDATNVEVSNMIPSGFTVVNVNDGGVQTGNEILWTVLNVPNGTTTTLTFEASINVPTNTADEYLNTVQIVNVDQLDPDSTPNNDDGDQSEDDEDNAEIVLIPADLSLDKALSSASNPAPNSGDTVTFELTLTNDGPGIATNVSIEDTLPSGYTLGTVNNGGSVSGNVITWNFANVPVGIQVVSYEVTLNTPNNVVDEYTNIAQVISSDQFDPNSTPNNDDGDQSEDDEVSHMINAPTVDLEIMKSVDKEETFFEDTVVFTVTVMNNSTYAATNIGVEDVLPSGYEFIAATATDGDYSETTSTWDIPSIAIGATASLEMTVNVTDVDDYTNVAELIYVDQVDLNIDNDRAEATPLVTQAKCFTVFNKFTPNNDGFNDVFFIECIENYPNNNVKVFNRWGNQVFEMDNYDNTWDGTSMGRATVSASEKLPVGTYFYLIDFGDGSEPKTGWLYITR
ncbi:gliding motility-associated C-terminal domain-containing protein [Maribacter sp. BPC-D8]|uniref:Ig-like domain-containing protein n=1 Tax=Maribacter sp. BPC-D8 TaxID=3053613 RepID=UPI002B45FCD2|nr:gliding motility-associated C-terminal domain-containing protein [Maribacter sp. BPC-D8]WRI28308.1 gliding motility-associated C-terminal domain-containing protein [Maribacter sp. BPC-D8]